MGYKNFSIGILIATYNWPEALELIFKSIGQQTLQPHEILIADDGSGIETTELIKKYRRILKAPIKHARQEDKGFRKSLILNKAIKLSTADYIIEIDGDILLHPKFIQDHVDAAERSKFVQGARAMVNERTTQAILDGKITRLNFFSPGIKNRFNSLRIPALGKLIKANVNSSQNIKACNIAFWRKDYITINGYNNAFCGWGWEDYELAARLINAGVKKKRLKLSAICYHLFHERNPRDNVFKHEELYNETIKNHLVYCAYGYNEA